MVLVSLRAGFPVAGSVVLIQEGMVASGLSKVPLCVRMCVCVYMCACMCVFNRIFLPHDKVCGVNPGRDGCRRAFQGATLCVCVYKCVCVFSVLFLPHEKVCGVDPGGEVCKEGRLASRLSKGPMCVYMRVHACMFVCLRVSLRSIKVHICIWLTASIV